MGNFAYWVGGARPWRRASSAVLCQLVPIGGHGEKLSRTSGSLALAAFYASLPLGRGTLRVSSERGSPKHLAEPFTDDGFEKCLTASVRKAPERRTVPFAPSLQAAVINVRVGRIS